MRRGRIFIYLALIVVVLIVVIVLWLKMRGGAGTASATPTPEIQFAEIVVAGQNILPGTAITENMLSTMRFPADQLSVVLYTNIADVVGQYAVYPIAQGVPITTGMISTTPGNVNLPGSPWSTLIPQGLTAITIPTTRLSLAGYGIRDGDYVNVIVTLLLVDVDTSFQTSLPNNTSVVTGGGVVDADIKAPLITMTLDAVMTGGTQGRTEGEAALNQAIYVIPSEAQRPRMASKMIMQNVQVLHVGTFPLPGEETTEQLVATEPSAATTPVATTPAAVETEAVVERPDIVTLLVTPQDAVTLNYLIFSGAQITLTLRNPNDVGAPTPTEAVVLSYLLTQYNIPLPAKLPYAITPRIDELIQPDLPGDVIVIPAE